jgi:hypothetical protein
MKESESEFLCTDSTALARAMPYLPTLLVWRVRDDLYLYIVAHIG